MAVNQISCKLENMILTIMKIVNIDLEIKKESTGINMSYNFITDKIGYDPERIYEARKELHRPISLETYIQVFTLHELGHALDRDSLLNSLEKTLEIFEMKKKYSIKEQYNNPALLVVLIEEHEMNIQFEITAWDHAENLNKQFKIVKNDVFDQVRAHSLKTYIDLYESDLEIYNQLLLKDNLKSA